MRALMLMLLATAACTPGLDDGQFTCRDGMCPGNMECCPDQTCQRLCDDAGADAATDAAADVNEDVGPDVGADVVTEDTAVDTTMVDAAPDTALDAPTSDGGTICDPACVPLEECNLATGSCALPDSLSLCSACSTTGFCRDGDECVIYGDQGYCMPTGSCPNVFPRSGEAVRIDDGTTITVCLPSDEISCMAVQSYLSGVDCDGDDQCGPGGGCVGGFCTLPCEPFGNDCLAADNCTGGVCRS